jgi:uncharacterized protein
MRLNVSHLLKAPIGTKDEVHLDTEAITLGNDLDLHYLRGTIHLTRSTNSLLAEGELETTLDSQCVRCLADFVLPLIVELDDLAFGLPYTSPKEYQYRVNEDGWLFLDRALREQILLSVPIRPLCRAACRGLCSQCGQDLNVAACDCEDQSIDPRLSALKDLL